LFVRYSATMKSSSCLETFFWKRSLLLSGSMLTILFWIICSFVN
jgi:hypothetical protein